MMKIGIGKSAYLILASFAALAALSSCAGKSTAPVRAVSAVTRGPTPAPEDWEYDAGPDLSTPMGRELLQILKDVPNFGELSEVVMGRQKFRLPFGAMPFRMLLKPNSIKMFFIGQDGTHIAEAAGYPGTAGFGGREADQANHFGVQFSLATINSYASTIKGQAAYPNAPLIQTAADGSVSVTHGTLTDNSLWAISQDPDSPIVKWRNRLIDWIIRNNSQSLEMIVTYGGAARDTLATYLISKGVEIDPKITPERLSRTRVPRMAPTSTGGNGETAYPVGKNGEDLYALAQGKPVNYKDPAALEAAQNAFDAAVKADPAKWMGLIDFADVSPTGVLNPAQIGGYNMVSGMRVNGQQTISLKGLKIGDTVFDHHVPCIALVHPTMLSKMTPDKAATEVGKSLLPLDKYRQDGWRIPPDAGYENHYDAGEAYKYRRGDLPTQHFAFGTPRSRMVNVSSASRDGADKIIFGTRATNAEFDEDAIKAIQNSTYSDAPDPADNWTMHSRVHADVFDPGPGPVYAPLMLNNIPDELRDDKKRAANADFGHYRGTFNKPRVVILADPDGYDDLSSSRALTGARGQYLNGLMSDLGVGEQYLVLATAPFSLLPTEIKDDWKEVIEKTKIYREKLLAQIMSDGVPTMIIADGPYAADEIKRIYGDKAPCKVVNVRRSKTSKAFGIADAGQRIKAEVPEFANANLPTAPHMKDIPRSHLTYNAREWVGRGGDHVIASITPEFRRTAFMVIAPKWAIYQKDIVTPAAELAAMERLSIRVGAPKPSAPDPAGPAAAAVDPVLSCGKLFSQ